MNEPCIDELTGKPTMGYDFDGIEERNNPMPRRWLITFHASIVWSILYMIAFLALPMILTTLPYEEASVEGATEMVRGFKAQGIDEKIVSGDTEARTAVSSKKLGVGACRSGPMPEDKNERVAKLDATGSLPWMFGDGLNDTIALARAHASLAPGEALDAARNAADVVVLRKNLDQVPDLFVIACRAVALSPEFWHRDCHSDCDSWLCLSTCGGCSGLHALDHFLVFF